MSRKLFEIKNLKVLVEDKLVLKGINLTMKSGEVHAIMGRNGSGKSTLAFALMGHPKYKIQSGEILFDGERINDWAPEERARKGLFLAFQNPVSIPGVSVANFVRSAIRAVRGKELSPKELRSRIKEEATALQIPHRFLARSVNDGFSGGEKKRLEMLQMRLLEPKVAILDETDSGLDIDALKLVAERVEALRSPDRAILLITHYQRMLNYVRPDHVHVLLDGKIVKSGDAGLALDLEKKGYEWLESTNLG